MARIDKNNYPLDYPSIQGLSEIHIFLQPFNPPDDLIKKYEEACEEYNQRMLSVDTSKFLMKACVLCLNYRKLGDVTVLQSSRYIYSQDTQQVIEETYKDGQWFVDRGFDLLRHKIETITTAKGVPQNQEWSSFPRRYFEFHIRVCKSDESEDNVITEKEVEELKAIAKEFTELFRTPIPLSYNKSAVRHQRYLNARFENCGAEEARAKVNMIKDGIEKLQSIKLVKTISEYVWYDDNRAVDSGWIDFNEEEKENLLGIHVV